MTRASLALLGALALCGCATDRVTLLDNEAGRPDGALAVLSPDGETLIDKPNTQALLRSGTPRTRSFDPDNPAYNALLDSLPPPAARFSITFPFDESRIPESQRGVLDQIRAELTRRQGAQIEVAGFSDSKGSEAYNDNLSRLRAESVARELRENGFEIDQADAVGRGEDEARAQLGDEVYDENFRRVDVIVR